ncbi:D-proline reductase (dithiol) proprotein PrdA [Listeria monocytogenes]|uniref:D-proline reductase (dithiol) proprotein PrdA n=1 Tax=Listeria innocua TaxID=1642 RepID=UPI0010B2B5C4|nr:D-proline reductase (dithiol) proprotein PrdA [Listeria innocua]EAC4616736.1 D-proline reductase (dithiol) proprotein PrdA [Listeria monocytogenes]EAC7083278.1 D-proline reductase (dithiol) proprotein PrdA [Listeria monocytogenes]EAD0622408.1 D-proline reductase (dithiol) proprotein PrdA [Listeria monocytogenes]EAD8589815.1 D-proline reductase (dithiol) proprotein PrdA [Listeria monocytogenes]EAD8593113.1 D-proline reductase (dithiol) proprotein PrdA [Listeria monocytogenes]
MSITVETAKEHASDPAVLCCRAEAGITIEPSNLEDPAIFADLEDSGLLTIPDNGLKIGQVLGAKLLKTTDALVPLTVDLVEGVLESEEVSESAEQTIVAESSTMQPAATVQEGQVFSGQTIKIHIEEGKGINLEVPIPAIAAAMQPTMVSQEQTTETTASVTDNLVGETVQEQKIRGFKRKHFKIEKVVFAEETKIEGTTLYLRAAEALCQEAAATEKLVEGMKLEIITPDAYGTYSETIMDVQPIATKEDGEIGEGVTRILDGVVMILTGTDANGVQIGEFGSSEGELDRNIMWGRPGAPDKGEIFIKAQVTIKAGTNMERSGPLAAHQAADYVTEEIRKALKQAEETLVVDTEEITQYRRPSKKKVLVIKEIMGQGAMHDNLIMPIEPVGTLGAKPNVDLGNLPVILAPTEVLDGGIHALTCIGPASKETSRHYFREPLVTEAMKDEEIDLVGIAFVGSPQANSEKFYVSKRLGMMVEAMGIDGAIITTEGFGNNHIDFASHIEELGKRGVKVVGESFSAMQGALVVGNKYMEAMIDNNKSKQGIENEVLSNNTLCKEDAIRALAMLKTLLGGGQIDKPERKWNPNVKQSNIEVIEKQLGTKIDLVENEQVLPKSEKRRKIYEKDEA